MPGDKFPPLTFLQWLNPDKIIHLILFGVECFLLLKAFCSLPSGHLFNRRAALYAMMLSIGYGCVVEILQATVFTNRSGDIRDAIVNAIGAWIGLRLFNRLYSGKKINEKATNRQ